MNLKQIEDGKRQELINRMHDAMIDNYKGGDEIIVNNHQEKHNPEAFGTTLISSYDWFTNLELSLINKLNVLNQIRSEGWEITEITNPANSKSIFIFKAVK